VVNRVQKRYNIKKEILKAYKGRVWDLIQTFNYFNIIFIPIERNQKVDSLVVSKSLFNPDSSLVHDSFWFKMIFRSSIPDN